jgi:hypothetical protein
MRMNDRRWLLVVSRSAFSFRNPALDIYFLPKIESNFELVSRRAGERKREVVSRHGCRA